MEEEIKMEERFDFSGWATKNDLLCADGRTIRRNAFKDCDGKVVPLVWQHIHNDPNVVLGHCLLENREDGVYAYGKFNDTDAGRNAREFVKNGDVTALSIYANRLKQKGGNVLHGVIREVSLVMSGANPGAYIEVPSLAHGDSEDSEFEGIIWNDDGTVDPSDVIYHSADNAAEEENDEMADKTVKDVIDSMDEDQQNVLFFLVGEAANGAANGDYDDVEHSDYDEDEYYDDEYDDEYDEEYDDDYDDDEDEDDEEFEHSDYDDEYYEGDYGMKYNVFDGSEDFGPALSHADEMDILEDAKRVGSLKESFLAHAEDYGIDGIEWLFPDDRELNNTPQWIKRDTDWVSKVMGSVRHTPFSRVRTTFADITEDEARAKGYIKGHMKKEEVFSLLRRATTPQTVYKKQKIDRDDKIDITDFDVVAWIKGEMRMMLNEEIARAILIGDGRLASDEDKISEDHIRPIANDADLFTIKKAVTVGDNDSVTAKTFIRAAIKARKDYKGSGNPTLFTTEDMLTEMLLLEDQIGHALYPTEQALATKLRVKDIVTVPVMENHKVDGKDLMGIIVNLTDYTVGADKGGAVEMFEDFDIDYNREKYLIETRCSGALTQPYSAIVLFKGEVPASVDGDVKKSKTVHSTGEETTGDETTGG
jgi:phage head maturation protease